MNQSKLRNNLFTFINLFIFVTAAIAIPVTLVVGSRSTRLEGSTSIANWQHVVTFTILSNIFLGLVALAATIQGVTNHYKKSFLAWYLAAASAGLITFFTVVFFLAPMRAVGGKDYFDLLLEPMFFLHFLNPVLAGVSFIFFTGHSHIALKSRFLAALPIVIYSIPYILNVAFLKSWPDFYGLTFGGKYYLLPLVFVVFILFAFGIATLLVFLRKKATTEPEL